MRASPRFRLLTRLATVLACVAMLAGSVAASLAQEPRRPNEAEAARRADQLLSRMTLDDKIDMMHGELNNFYGFYNAPIPRLGIPALTMADGPAGVRINDPNVNDKRATQWPVPLALAATWDPALAEVYGRLTGQEAHSTGHNVQLGPTLDPVRVPQWGRAFETYGENPLLIGILGSAFINGVQEGPVIAVPKHVLGYTQEADRFNSNDIVDERTLQEIYGRAYGMALPGSMTGAAMCSFNEVNGVVACQDPMLLERMLKGQFAFPGWVMTDYNANQSTVPAALAGLDQEMPGDSSGGAGYQGGYPAQGSCYFCEPLRQAVLRGEVPESRIDDAVRRMLYQMFLHGLFDEPPVIAPLPEAEHGAVARQIGEQAIVLLKNDGAALPLAGGLRSIAVIGSDADTIVNGGGSARVKPTYSVSPLDAIRARAGSDVRVDYLPGSDPVTSAAMVPGPDPVPSDFLTPPDGTGHGLRAEYFLNMDFSGAPGIDRIDPYAGLVGGFMWYEGFSANSPHFPAPPQAFTGPSSYRWTGRLAAPVTGDYELALTSNSTGRLYVDGKLVLSTEPVSPPATRTVPMHLEAGAAHDVRIEVVNDAPAERAEEGMQFQFGWIPPAGVVAPQAQAAAKLAHDADVAIVFVRDYSSEGQDHSLVLPNGQAEVIRQVAAANPHTIVVLTTAGATQTADWDGAAPALLQAFYDGQEQGNAIASVLFGDVNPSGRLPITMPVDAAHTPVSNPDQYPGTADGSLFSEGIFVGYRGYEEFGIAPRFPFGFGLSYTTFAYSDLQVGPGPHVTVTVANTGKVAGTETVQVYAGRLPAPVPTAPKALAGWAKVTLAPGENRDVTVALDPTSLSYWDASEHRWQPAVGQIPILVGSSSADILLTGSLEAPASGQGMAMPAIGEAEATPAIGEAVATPAGG